MRALLYTLCFMFINCVFLFNFLNSNLLSLTHIVCVCVWLIDSLLDIILRLHFTNTHSQHNNYCMRTIFMQLFSFFPFFFLFFFFTYMYSYWKRKKGRKWYIDLVFIAFFLFFVISLANGNWMDFRLIYFLFKKK